VYIRESRDLKQRLDIAKNEFNQWNTYIEHRKTELPNNMQLTDPMINRLKEIWKLLKVRKKRCENQFYFWGLKS
jgi:ribosome-associated toxin RatA of RatAB toxin-antitoxin module